jgi:hypothetical protein
MRTCACLSVGLPADRSAARGRVLCHGQRRGASRLRRSGARGAARSALTWAASQATGVPDIRRVTDAAEITALLTLKVGPDRRRPPTRLLTVADRSPPGDHVGAGCGDQRPPRARLPADRRVRAAPAGSPGRQPATASLHDQPADCVRVRQHASRTTHAQRVAEQLPLRAPSCEDTRNLRPGCELILVFLFVRRCVWGTAVLLLESQWIEQIPTTSVT